MGRSSIVKFTSFSHFEPFYVGLNDIINPDKSPNRKKRHDTLFYEQEIRNKLYTSSPVRSISMTPSTSSTTSVIMNSPSEPHSPDPSSSTHLRPPLSTITPIRSNQSTAYAEKKKPRLLIKHKGFRQTVMQKLKMSKHNR